MCLTSNRNNWIRTLRYSHGKCVRNDAEWTVEKKRVTVRNITKKKDMQNETKAAIKCLVRSVSESQLQQVKYHPFAVRIETCLFLPNTYYLQWNMVSVNETQMHSSYSSLITDNYCTCHNNDEVKFHTFLKREIRCISRGSFGDNVIDEERRTLSVFQVNTWLFTMVNMKQ